MMATLASSAVSLLSMERSMLLTSEQQSGLGDVDGDELADEAGESGVRVFWIFESVPWCGVYHNIPL